MSEPATLEIKDLLVYYGESTILRGVDLTVPPKSVLALLGRNGVGKTTTLKAALGIIPKKGGTISFKGTDLKNSPPEVRARGGIGYVPQGRDIFPSLTVWENLKISLSVTKGSTPEQLEEVYTLFPVLKEMLGRKGGVLSGGQQQQLAIGRALLTNPSLLLLDEPTEGIQPSIIDQIHDAILYLRDKKGISILLVEQYLAFARSVSDQFAIMERGKVVACGSTTNLTDATVQKHLMV